VLLLVLLTLLAPPLHLPCAMRYPPPPHPTPP
jgi:hypothetical protein